MTVLRDDGSHVVAKCQRCSGLGEVFHPISHLQIAFMVEQCPSCNGSGEAVYVRGSGLVPIIPRAGRLPPLKT